MLKVYHLYILLISSLYCSISFGQDSLTNRKGCLTIKALVNQRLPLSNSYSEKIGNKGGSVYYNFQFTEPITYGYSGAVGYSVPIGTKWMIHPELTYYYSQIIKIGQGESSCPGCYIPVLPFEGTVRFKNTFQTIGLQTSFKYQFKKFQLGNGLGFTKLIAQKNEVNFNNQLNKSETFEIDFNKSFQYDVFSIHKLEHAVWNKHIFLQGGFFISYNKAIKKAINPFLSIQYNFVKL